MITVIIESDAAGYCGGLIKTPKGDRFFIGHDYFCSYILEEKEYPSPQAFLEDKDSWKHAFQEKEVLEFFEEVGLI